MWGLYVFFSLSFIIYVISTDSVAPDCPQSTVDEVITHMDKYYLSKEDWDTIVELGVDEKRDDAVLKKISTATKTALTKR